MGSSSPILATRQMRAVEEAAISSGVETGSSLMERAGRAAAAAIAAHWPEFIRDGREALILCGLGNNGGDGYVIARHLAGQGWPVRVAALGQPGTVEAEGASALWRGQTVGIGSVSMASGRRIGLCIDALFGTGISRPLDPEIAGLLRGIAASGCPIAAVDILSGLCATSGRVLGDIRLPEADLTVTFHRPKLGHFLSDGGTLSGQVVTCDIGLEPWSEAAGDSVLLAGPSQALQKRAGHKYSHGHALIMAGGAGKGGAARLSGRAALRVGAGLVTVAPPPDALSENAARLDAIMLDGLSDAEAMLQRLRDPRINALCLGPGLGLPRAKELVPAALSVGRPVVLDADALTAFADGPDGLFAQLHEGAVLTPHDGEFARLFPDLARKVRDETAKGPAFSRLDAVRLAAARCGATVLLKGPDTVISSPEGRALIAAATGVYAAPWLATAGSGDVLSGLITGLLARGFEPLDAAGTAAWLHAEAARQFGPGLIAEDLPEAIPAVLRTLWN
ncbi:NAD(P)H-hydrate dehydratase [Paracoccus aestuariivivens]|uniref:Bifunctional NAD(P)H-hydrate repair enzyme n=1 Tax=Paracoccus aestuariivivens TaxID=1820333 RepID=A0A6L6JE34_9RHOB|nr:NAD(P)H-hydrate dehydratase [Paracoccus aestuariivivens]MTH79485.1 NAD(P)H-hydrate dehydratase [Paracoccus aestuariivivens]